MAPEGTGVESGNGRASGSDAPTVDAAQLSPGLRYLAERLDRLDAAVAALQDVSVRSGGSLGAEAHGLCGDPDCSGCVGAAQELVVEARRRFATELDEALLLVGGEPLRQRVYDAVVRGLELRNARAGT